MVIKWQTFINSLILELQEVVFVFQTEGLQRQRRKELIQRIQQAIEAKMGVLRQLRKLLCAVDSRNGNHPFL